MAYNDEDDGLLLLRLGIEDDEQSFRKARKEVDDFANALSDLTADVNLSDALNAVRSFKKLWDSLQDKSISLSVKDLTAGEYGLTYGSKNAIDQLDSQRIAGLYGITSEEVLRTINAVQAEKGTLKYAGRISDDQWRAYSQAAKETGSKTWGQTQDGLYKMMTESDNAKVISAFYDELLGPLFTKAANAKSTTERDRLLELAQEVMRQTPWASKPMYDYEWATRTELGAQFPIAGLLSPGQGNSTLLQLEQDVANADRTVHSAAQHMDQARKSWTRVVEGVVAPFRVFGANVLDASASIVEWGASLGGIAVKEGSGSALKSLGFDYANSYTVYPKSARAFSEYVNNYQSGHFSNKYGYYGDNGALIDYNSEEYISLLDKRIQASALNNDYIATELSVYDRVLPMSANYKTKLDNLMMAYHTRIMNKEGVSASDAEALMNNKESPYYINMVEQGLSYTDVISRMQKLGLISSEEYSNWIFTILDKFNPNDYKKLFTSSPDVNVDTNRAFNKGTSNTLDVKIGKENLKIDLGESRTYDLTVRDLYDVEVE